ncbi:MAG: PTS sugar transporter subunit IIA [Legionella sp.]|nr:PTS sugar transporter subunit IIA [Legionella sp.]
MQFSQLFTPGNVFIDAFSQSKTAVFHRISELLSANTPTLKLQDLFDAYWKRENLGSTAIGYGIIIPHIRTPLLKYPKACFIKLRHPVEFGAEDKQPADLVIGLASPQNQAELHLIILNNLLERFSQPSFRKMCRSMNTSESLYALLVNDIVEPVCA